MINRVQVALQQMPFNQYCAVCGAVVLPNAAIVVVSIPAFKWMMFCAKDSPFVDRGWRPETTKRRFDEDVAKYALVDRAGCQHSVQSSWRIVNGVIHCDECDPGYPRALVDEPREKEEK